jgi:hypothetical protein
MLLEQGVRKAKAISIELGVKNNFRKAFSPVFREPFTKLSDRNGFMCADLILPTLLECEEPLLHYLSDNSCSNGGNECPTSDDTPVRV